MPQLFCIKMKEEFFDSMRMDIFNFMIKEILSGKSAVSKTGFRYRGMEASRLENLTDAVFGFAITLLVIASEVPKTYVELQASMYDFVGFIFCILLLFGIWNNHNNFFKYYGLDDPFTKSLNFLFLFVLLFYIYPLKYLFSYIGTALLLITLKNFNYSSEAYYMAWQKVGAADLNVTEWADLMVRFGMGLFLIYGIMIFLHFNALKKKKSLELNQREIFETKTLILNYISLVLIASISMAIVIIFGGAQAPFSGYVYMSIPILIPIINKFRLKRMNRLYPL